MANIEPIGRRVVHLEPDNERLARARLARLPAPIHSVRETFQRQLLGLLKTYFERADDSLFDLADKASSNEEQNLYFDSMREVRVRRHGIENSFSQEIDNAFAQLLDGKAVPASDEAFDSLKADALALVQDDDLEEMVAVDTSVARANSQFGEAIQYVSLRLDSLVPVKVYQKNNPIGPDVLCRAFMSELKKLDASLKAKLLLFRLFDKNVIGALGDIYRQVNDILIEHNVLPSLPGRGAQQRRRATDHASSSAAQASAGGGQATVGEVAQALNSLLGESFEAAPASQVNIGAPAADYAAGSLLGLLTAAQRTPAHLQEGVIHKSKDVRTLIRQLSSQGSQQITLGRVEDQVINLVNMLFDFILEDRNLAPAMKMIISRMQIPIIKVALADNTFFAKRGHVARKLLNEMSTAAIGWQGDEKTTERDPLYRKMEEVVHRLLEDFDTDVEIFSDLLADFTAFLEKERKRVAILERRTLDAEDGKAKAEIARTTVALEIEVRVHEYILPDSLSQLINDAWSNVLFVTALKHGYFSAEWLGALTTLDELIWSLQEPKDAAHRQQLIKNVPQLLKKLRAGLDTISYNPFEMSSLFKALEEVHLQCIRGKSPVRMRSEDLAAEQAEQSAAEAPAQDTAAEPAKAPEVHQDATIEQKGHDIEEIDIGNVGPFSEAAGLNSIIDKIPDAPVEETVDEIHLQQVSSFVQGAWFDMKDASGNMMRCRLAAYIRPTRKYIFVNRNGMKVAERTQHELAVALKLQNLRALDNSMLFDRALETVVSSLRKNRT